MKKNILTSIVVIALSIVFFADHNGNSAPTPIAPNHEVVGAYELVIRYNPSISVLRIFQWSPGILSRGTVDIGYIDQPQVEAGQYIHLAYMKLDAANRDTVQYRLYQDTQQLLQSYQFPLPPKTDVKAIALRLNGPEVHVVIAGVNPQTLQSVIYYFTRATATASWQLQRFSVAGLAGDGLEFDLFPQINYAAVAFTRQTAASRDVVVLEINHANRTNIQSVVFTGNAYLGNAGADRVRPISFRISPYMFSAWLNYAQTDLLNNPQLGVQMDEGGFAQPMVWQSRNNFSSAWGSSVSYRFPFGFNVATVEGQGSFSSGGRDLYLYGSPNGVVGPPVLLDSGPQFHFPAITRQDANGNFYIGVAAMTNPSLGQGELRLYNPQGSYVLLEPSGGAVYYRELDVDLRY